MNPDLITLSFVLGIFAASIRLATPILFAAVGEIFVERAGILNLGLEGMMLMGCVSGFLSAYLSGNLWLGVLVALVVGMLMGLLMAFISVTVQANQVVAGLGITILGTGLSTLLFRTLLGIRQAPPSVEPFSALNFPILSDLPYLGPVLFSHNALVYIAIILAVLGWLVLSRTSLGLAVRAVGENPRAADTKGINVYHIRYLCLLIGGGLAGLGGAFLSLAFLNTYWAQMTAGRGFIAIAVVIFARWNPIMAIGAALVFGGAESLRLAMQTIGAPVPSEFLFALPYILTILVLIGVSRRAEFPAAFTLPYRREGE